MEGSLKKKKKLRFKRKMRIRNSLSFSEGAFRLVAIKSNMHLDVQVVNPVTGVTLFSVGTKSKEMRDLGFNRKNKNSAKKIGEVVAKKAKENNIEKLVFDRGFSSYHGIFEEIANSLRAEGLKI